MTNQVQPTELFIGKRDAVIAELGGLTHIYDGKYLIQPMGDDNWDAEGADTIKDAKALLKAYRAAYPAARVCWID